MIDAKEVRRRFELILADTPHPVPLKNRLARALKALLRSYGLRVVTSRELEPHEGAEAVLEEGHPAEAAPPQPTASGAGPGR